MTYVLPDNFTWKELKSGIVVLNLDSSDYYTLNDTASTIWRAVMDGCDDDAIAQRLTEEYDCPPDVARRDVREQMERFCDDGMLVTEEEEREAKEKMG